MKPKDSPLQDIMENHSSDADETLKRLEKLSAEGFIEAQNAYGNSLIARKLDINKGISMLNLSFDNGCNNAAIDLVRFYIQSEDRDLIDQVPEILRKAAERGCIKAMKGLTMPDIMYRTGTLNISAEERESWGVKYKAAKKAKKAKKI